MFTIKFMREKRNGKALTAPLISSAQTAAQRSICVFSVLSIRPLNSAMRSSEKSLNSAKKTNILI